MDNLADKIIDRYEQVRNVEINTQAEEIKSRMVDFVQGLQLWIAHELDEDIANLITPYITIDKMHDFQRDGKTTRGTFPITAHDQKLAPFRITFTETFGKYAQSYGDRANIVQLIVQARMNWDEHINNLSKDLLRQYTNAFESMARKHAPKADFVRMICNLKEKYPHVHVAPFIRAHRYYVKSEKEWQEKDAQERAERERAEKAHAENLQRFKADYLAYLRDYRDTLQENMTVAQAWQDKFDAHPYKYSILRYAVPTIEDDGRQTMEYKEVDVQYINGGDNDQWVVFEKGQQIKYNFANFVYCKGEFTAKASEARPSAGRINFPKADMILYYPPSNVFSNWIEECYRCERNMRPLPVAPVPADYDIQIETWKVVQQIIKEFENDNS